MNTQITPLSSTDNPTMSSLQIAEITGKLHTHVMRDIREVLEQAEIEETRFGSYYIAANGKKNLFYNLPRRECDLVISGYSVKYRLAIIDRWQELEAKQAFALPTTFAEALRLSADQAETIDKQNAALILAAPKIEFSDVCQGSDDVIQLAMVAQIAKLPFGRNILFQKLREARILLSGGERHNMPFQQYVKSGHFTVNQTTIEIAKTKETKIVHTTYATQKGLAMIISKFGKEANKVDELPL